MPPLPIILPTYYGRSHFVLKRLDQLAEEAEKEANAVNNLAIRVLKQVSGTLYGLIEKTTVEKKRILEMRKEFINRYLIHIKALGRNQV